MPGTHGVLAEEGDPDAPVCLDCHSKHGTLGRTNPLSPTYARNVPDLCATCHREGESVARRVGDLGYPQGIVGSYEMSIHGEGLIQSGLVVTATCDDCHTAHGPLPSDDPQSSIHPDNVSATCGVCHHGIEEEFEETFDLPIFYLTQLMGLAFGVTPKELGLQKHFVDPFPLLREKSIV